MRVECFLTKKRRSLKKPDNFYIALLHFPVYNRRREVVTAAVANMDIHDIARAATTYGVNSFYIVTPIPKQHDLIGKILNHWLEGYGSDFNPSRREAFEIVRLKRTLEEVREDISESSGRRAKIIATGANLSAKGSISTNQLRGLIQGSADPFVMIFGTGSGLTDEIVNSADYRLMPIAGFTDYNHLSVRSAVSIVLDRLWGKV